MGCTGQGQRLHAQMADTRPSSDVIRRRRLAALGIVAAAAALVGAAVGAGDGSRGDSTEPVMLFSRG